MPDVETQAAPADPEVDSEIPSAEMMNALEELSGAPIPWHGVLAPIEKLSGDNRIFAEGSMTHRDLPLPLKGMREDLPGHDGSVVVANIEKIWEEGGLILAEGTFVSNEDAAYFIQLRVDGAMRGLSVDVDMAESMLEDQDGNPIDMNKPFDASTKVIERVTSGRIAAATICAIPAFQEAYFDLGTWEEALASNEECKDCPPADPNAPAPVVAASGWGGGIEAVDAVVESVETDEVPPAIELNNEEPTVLSASTETFAPGTHDGPGWITNPKATQRIRKYWVRGKGAAKIEWGVPGDFNRCRAQLAKYVRNPEWLAGLCANMHKEALGVWPGGETGKHSEEDVVTASGKMAPAFTMIETVESITAAANALPKSWFDDPQLDGPTPLTITPDGRVFGHAASWNECHIGIQDRCVIAPHSITDYAYFHVGEVLTSDGPVAVGHITMNTGHAALNLDSGPAAAHYDNTGAVVADIHVGEDKHGIWMAGAMRSTATEEQIHALRAAAISGDWRPIGAGIEMVAALAVNTPGFPIPRTALAASGTKTLALVAAGVIQRDSDDHTQEDSLREFARAVIREVHEDSRRMARVGEIRAAINRENEARANSIRALLGEEDAHGM